MRRPGCQDGTEIRRLREESLGISVTALATRVGINPQSMSNIELGNSPASVATLIKIARELDVRLDEIIRTDTDEDTPAEESGDEDEPEGAAAA